MSFRFCENCVADRAVANSDLCQSCEDMLDEQARQDGMTRAEYTKALGVVALPIGFGK